MKRNWFLYLLCLIFAGIAVFSGYKIISTLREYKAGEDAYEELQQYLYIPEATKPSEKVDATEAPGGTEGTAPAEETVPLPRYEYEGPLVDFDALLDINEDVVGWIYLEDSKVNFPIAQGEDNKEYLYWLINGDYNGAGTPFMDYRNARDFSDRHTIIYGHNMNNGSMFADIHKYVDQEYYESHPVIWLLTPQGNLCMEVFAGYITQTGVDAWQVYFDSDGEFESWLGNALQKSAFVTPVVPTAQDRIVTLSTCSNSANQTRFVLLGVIR